MKMKTWEYLKQHELAYDEPYWLDLTTLLNDILYRHHESSIAVDHLSRRGVRSGSGVPPLG